MAQPNRSTSFVVAAAAAVVVAAAVALASLEDVAVAVRNYKSLALFQMGQKGAKKLCGPQLWRKFSFVPPIPTLCDPKFLRLPYRAILGGTSLFEAFFPPLEKSRCPCVLIGFKCCSPTSSRTPSATSGSIA